MNFQFLLKTFSGLALLIFSCYTLNAQSIEPLISIQGTLKDNTGASVEDDEYKVTFKLYDSETGGEALWTEVIDQLPVIGGIYSHNLGSETPFDDFSIFGQNLYLGVTVGSGQELAPRTALTYAPYALSVRAAQEALKIAANGCSGAVGDIKYSILNPEQFRQENGDCWVPLDGNDYPGSRLATDYGWNDLPDMSGLFMRATEYNNGNDPGRSAMARSGSFQADDNRQHSHAINLSTSTNGNHSHRYSDWYDTDKSGTIRSDDGDREQGGDDDGLRRRTRTVNTSTTGNHSHTVSGNSANQGTESRPKNRNFYIYIRIN